MAEVIFRGASGRLHRFNAYRPSEAFAQTAAVYCFARPSADGRGWTPLFLSRTANLAKRLAHHERWAEAELLGATHVLVHQRDERDAREFVEADLARSMRPVMNAPHDAAVAEEVAAGAPVRLVWAA